MKSLFFATSVCLAASTALFSAAHDTSSSSRKEVCEELAFYTAKDTTPFFIENLGTPQFTAIPFTQNMHFHGKGIRAISTTQVQLDEGFYLVSYSGTSEIIFQPPADSFTEIDYAIFLGSTEYFDFMDSSEVGFDRFRLSSFTTTVEVRKKSVLTIQAAIVTVGASANIDNRSLVITRLEN